MSCMHLMGSLFGLLSSMRTYGYRYFFFNRRFFRLLVVGVSFTRTEYRVENACGKWLWDWFVRHSFNDSMDELASVAHVHVLWSYKGSMSIVTIRHIHVRRGNWMGGLLVAVLLFMISSIICHFEFIS